MAWDLCYRARRLCMPCCHDSCVMAMLCCCFLCMLCVVAMLQSWLTRAAGHWQQHKASMIQLRNRTLLSRTNTTDAELYYLRHMRSCAAATMGNKVSNPSPSAALEISSAGFIGRLLQSICRQCYLTVFLQRVCYYAKIARRWKRKRRRLTEPTLTWTTWLGTFSNS